MSLRSRLVGLHPGFLCAAFVVVFAAAGALNFNPPLPFGTGMLVLGPLEMLVATWLYAIFLTGRRVMMARGARMRNWSWLFWIVLAGMLPLSLAAFRVMSGGDPVSGQIAAVLLLVVNPSFFVANAMTAAALQRAGRPDGAANFGEQVLNFFLLFYYPIGAWILWSRLRRLQADDLAVTSN